MRWLRQGTPGDPILANRPEVREQMAAQSAEIPAPVSVDYDRCASVYITPPLAREGEYVYMRYGWRDWQPDVTIMVCQWWRFPCERDIQEVLDELGLTLAPRAFGPEGIQLSIL